MATRAGYNIVNQYGLYFVTFTIVGWVDVFSRKACKTIMVEALQYCVAHKGLGLHAYVIMESHVHYPLFVDAVYEEIPKAVCDCGSGCNRLPKPSTVL